MADVEAIQQELRSILAQPVPKPSAAVCAVIGTIRELIDVNGTIAPGWRGGANRFRHVGSTESFRSGSGGSPGIPRVTSQRSFGSAESGSPASPQGSPGIPPPPVAKYQSKFKNSTQPVEDKILNNIILSKLNKFSPKTYDEIRDFLYQILGSGEIADLQEMTRDFMRLVFRKAAVEEMFCPLYAKLLCELSGRYRVILEEMQALQANYLAIFDEVENQEGANYEAFVEHQRSKQYRKGYSQFLAELSALEILDVGLLNSTFQRILANMVASGKDAEKRTLFEDYADCLLRMAKTLRRKPGAFFGGARSALLATNGAAIQEFTERHAEYPAVSAKTRFVLMDVLDSLSGR